MYNIVGIDYYHTKNKKKTRVEMLSYLTSFECTTSILLLNTLIHRCKRRQVSQWVGIRILFYITAALYG